MSNPIASLIAVAVAATPEAVLKGALRLGESMVMAFFQRASGSMLLVTVGASGSVEKLGYTTSGARSLWTNFIEHGAVRLSVPAPKESSGAKPHFAHDCDKCRYVGSAENEAWGKFDAYVCTDGCVIARLSDTDSDYLARSAELVGLGDDPSYPIEVAYQLAVLAGAVAAH